VHRTPSRSGSTLTRVQQSFQTLIVLAISEATILKYVLQMHLALARWGRMATERILTAPAMHVDETSIRVGKHWRDVCSAGDITLKVTPRLVHVSSPVFAERILTQLV